MAKMLLDGLFFFLWNFCVDAAKVAIIHLLFDNHFAPRRRGRFMGCDHVCGRLFFCRGCIPHHDYMGPILMVSQLAVLEVLRIMGANALSHYEHWFTLKLNEHVQHHGASPSEVLVMYFPLHPFYSYLTMSRDLFHEAFGT